MKKTIIYCKDLVKHNKIKQISNRLFNVDDHQIKLVVKKRRMLILCDCDNSSIFGHNQFCIHKMALINYLCNKNFYVQLNKLIELYSNWRKMNLPVKVDNMICDLENLKSL